MSNGMNRWSVKKPSMVSAATLCLCIEYNEINLEDLANYDCFTCKRKHYGRIIICLSYLL